MLEKFHAFHFSLFIESNIHKIYFDTCSSPPHAAFYFFVERIKSGEMCATQRWKVKDISQHTLEAKVGGRRTFHLFIRCRRTFDWTASFTLRLSRRAEENWYVAKHWQVMREVYTEIETLWRWSQSGKYFSMLTCARIADSEQTPVAAFQHGWDHFR